MKNLILSSMDIHEVYIRTSDLASKDHDYIAFNLNVQSDSITTPLKVAVQATRFSNNSNLSFGLTDSDRIEDFESIVKDGEDSSSELYQKIDTAIGQVFSNVGNAIFDVL